MNSINISKIINEHDVLLEHPVFLRPPRFPIPQYSLKSLDEFVFLKEARYKPKVLLSEFISRVWTVSRGFSRRGQAGKQADQPTDQRWRTQFFSAIPSTVETWPSGEALSASSSKPTARTRSCGTEFLKTGEADVSSSALSIFPLASFVERNVNPLLPYKADLSFSFIFLFLINPLRLKCDSSIDLIQQNYKF